MPADAPAVAARVAAELEMIADPGVAAALRELLVPPRACLLDWDYGHKHPEFRDPRYPGFIVAEHPDSDTAIAFSEYGFGPRCPWGLVFLSKPGFGMDSGWFTDLEAAFRDSMAFED